jgi:hypothetical protein
MAPDPVFHGPVDTRIASLPPLQFGAVAEYTGALAYFKHLSTAARETWGAATWASRLDDQDVNYLGSIGNQAAAALRAIDVTNQPPGKHRVVVTFFDPDRNHESPPSEVGVIDIEREADQFASDAERRIVVDNLPISPDRRPTLWRRIYKTLADGGVFFLLHEVRDNRTRKMEIAPSDQLLVQGEEVDFNYAEAPRCRVIRASEDRMFFAGLPAAPNVVAFSDPFKPWQVPGTQRNILEAVEGNPVSALAYIDGRLLALKRDSYFVIDVVGGRFSRVQRINSNTGAVSHHSLAELSDGVFFAAEKGIYRIDGTSRLLYLSRMIEEDYHALDQVFLPACYGAYHRLRNQYLFTGRTTPRRRPDLLYTAEVPDSIDEPPEVIWSKQKHPMGITALISADDVFTDQQRLVFGTSDGFVGLLDIDNGVRGHEDSTTASLKKPFLNIQGTPTGDISSFKVPISNPGGHGYDITEKDGLAGIPFQIIDNLSYTRADGTTQTYPYVWYEGVIFDVIEDGGTYYLRPCRPEDVDAIAPAPNVFQSLYLGGWSTIWNSKWFTHGEPVRDGETLHAEFVLAPESSGTFNMVLFENLDEDAVSLSRRVEMDDGYVQDTLSGHSKFFKIQLSRYGNLKPLEIYFMAIRHSMEGQR